MLLPVQRVRSRTSHDHFDHPLIVVFMMPFRTQLCYFLIKLNADSTTHTNYHGFTFENFQAFLKMLDYILSNELYPFLCADNCLELSPLGFKLFFPFKFFALCNLFKFRIDFRFFTLIEVKLGQAAFIIDGNRGLVFNRPLNVIDADIISENCSGISIGSFEWSSGKSYKRSSGQSISHMPGITVNKIILAAVGFIGYDHNIISSGKNRV